MNYYKYMTVRNVYTKQAVPFKITGEGEVAILSPDPRDNEDTCFVSLGNTFFDYSIDFKYR